MTTKIEWVRNADGSQGYTINPVKGLCPVACDYCYARRMYLNPYYKSMYQHPEVRWYPPAFDLLDTLKKPSRIFVGSTFELFLESLPENWMEYNLLTANKYPQHTFIFLTKQPQNLPAWSPFPDNCWVGVSATNAKMAEEAGFWLWEVKAKVKFVSFEPLLERIPIHFSDYLSEDIEGIKWVIIGQQTPVKKAPMPKIEWIREIVEACDKARIPVFLKNNLRDFIYGEDGGKYKRIFKYEQDGSRELRQELP